MQPGRIESMKFAPLSRQSLSAIAILLYFAPIFFFVAYSTSQMSLNKSWTLLTVGILLLAVGTLSFTLLLYYWERRTRAYLERSLMSGDSTSAKEPKVTLLDPLLHLDPSSKSEVNEQSFVLKDGSKDEESWQCSLNEKQEELARLIERLEQKEIECQTLVEENKQLSINAVQSAQDLSDYKLFTEEQIKQKNLQMAALQQVIEDQRLEVEKRQDQIYHLDTKIHDLSYEIKTLIYLHESEAGPTTPSFLKEEFPNKTVLRPSELEKGMPTRNEVIRIDQQDELTVSSETPIQSPQEAINLLRKCVNMAQKLTGANYYSNEATRFREFSSSHYTIDQRRLFESLRGENSGLVLVYSLKENRLLFANNQSKNLLGWSPEKFVSDFPGFIQDGIGEWKKALHGLSTNGESQARVLAKTKHGHEVILNCHFGSIPTGLFRNYVIGVLYTA